MQTAESPGAEGLFLYSKALMRQNLPMPPPEHLTPITVHGALVSLPSCLCTAEHVPHSQHQQMCMWISALKLIIRPQVCFQFPSPITTLLPWLNAVAPIS